MDFLNKMEKVKRERGKNYSEKEKQLVLELARKYYDVVESKQIDALTNKRKNECWDRIAEEFSLVAENGPRTGYQLKMLYQSIKKMVRKGILNGNKDYVFLSDPLDNGVESETNDDNFTPKIEIDDDSCFEITDNLITGSENSCSSSNFYGEEHKYPQNFSTPNVEERKNNEINFSNVQKIQLNFKNSDSQSNISSISRENTPTSKRERSKNFTEGEKRRLMDVVAKYVDILETKETDSKSLQRKNDCWEKILNEFHTFAVTGPRTKDQLKQLYCKQKKKVSDPIFDNVPIIGPPIDSLGNIYEDTNEHNGRSNFNANQEKSNSSDFSHVRNLQSEESTPTNQNRNSTNHTETSDKSTPLRIVNVKTEQPSFTEAEPPSPETHHQSQLQIEPLIQQTQKEAVPEPSTKRKKPNETPKEKFSYRENVERVKYEILLVRKEKEELERDILLLELRKKELEVREKESQLREIENKNLRK